MKRLKRFVNDQKGQALPMVLALFAVGGLALTPTIKFAASSMFGIRNNEMGVRGLYAADAGVEYVLWALKNGQTIPTQLPENVNGMAVTMQTVGMGATVLYLGTLVTGVHNDYLVISSDDSVWDATAQAFIYSITVTWQPGSGSPTIHLQQVGARLPNGYSYKNGSAASSSFQDNLSTANPSITTDASGAQMVSWNLPGNPSVSGSNPVATEKFYMTGTGDLAGYYSWVVTNRNDVGTVSEISGNFYVITATATSPANGVITASIVADAVVDYDNNNNEDVISWQVLK